MCVDLGGCLTGEHGVGIEKRELMPRQFTAAELAQQKRVRAVFDPDGRAQSGQGLPAGRTRPHEPKRYAAAEAKRTSSKRSAPRAAGGVKLDIVGGGTRGRLGRPPRRSAAGS